jgi:tRNA-specific 2-thiouridylase
MSRVVLAMSGGVDSSVAAHLLLEAGHDVVGVFMRHGEESVAACSLDGKPIPSLLPIVQERADHKQGCCSASDAADARRVADRLGIPFYALNLKAEFRQIIDYFVEEYTVGRTPNPCVMCNNWLKFGRLFDYADSIGADFVATGHYARLEQRPGDRLPALCKGVDDGKDQSYVLFGISRELLPRMMLPVGDYYKPRIREIAASLGLRVADKKDSQEICFVTSGKHDEFVRERRGSVDMSGEIVTTEGRVVGTHPGIERFTVGQRKGMKVAMGEPFFVVRIEPETRRVVIGKKEELARRELTAGRTNWLIDDPPTIGETFRCMAKIRYNSPRHPATCEILPDNRLQLIFDDPRYGVAPGQAAVCFDGDRVLGGGWIVYPQGRWPCG